MSRLADAHLFCHGGQERFGVRRYYLPAARTVSDWIMCLLATSKNKNSFETVVELEWQDVVIVLQENCALLGKLFCKVLALWSGDV